MEAQQSKTGIARAIVAAGGQGQLGRLLGVSQQAVSQWLAQGWVPIKRAGAIEREFFIPRSALVNPELIKLIHATAPDA